LSRAAVFEAGVCENGLFTKRFRGVEANLVCEFDIDEGFDIDDVGSNGGMMADLLGKLRDLIDAAVTRWNQAVDCCG
jgi:hypothetical protein